MKTILIKQVQKRNGQVVNFDFERVVNVIYKAMSTTENGDKDDATKIARKVIYILNNDIKDDILIPNVEKIQDIIEEELIVGEHAKAAKAFILYRQKRAELRKQRKEVSVPDRIQKITAESKKYFSNLLSEFVYYTTYSKWIPNEKRRETWIETVDRYIDFMKENIKNKLTIKEYDKIREYILNMKALGSMRLLWASGNAARATNVAAYNCSFIAPTKWQDFAEIAYILMCGTGVGFSVEEQNISKLPFIEYQTKEKLDTFVILDSKEGWSDAIALGLTTWASGKDISFDYSKIREQGARLKTMGGRASGPEPLKNFLNFARETILKKQGRRLSTINVHDIICKIGEIVVMGGVRRSALISLSDLDDIKMREAKNGQFYLTHSERIMSNNSAVYTEKPTVETFLEEWINLIKGKSGERGIFNRGGLKKQLPARRWEKFNKDYRTSGINPCVIGSSIVAVADGRNGVAIEELAKEGKDVPVYSRNPTSQLIEIKMGRQPRKTGKKKEVWKITLDDNSTMIATPEHKIIMRNGQEKELKELKKGESIMSFNSYVSNNIYRQISETSKRINHKVKSIKFYGYEDVYNLTVDDNHNYIILTSKKDDNYITSSGICVKNCGEIVLKSKQFCNLSEVVARVEDTEDDLIDKVKIAAILGTYQASLIDFPYLSKEWKKNCKEEALLGVSITGQWDCPALRNPQTLRKLKEIAIETNKKYAKKFNINESTAITCVKPSGNGSQLFNSSSGCHPRHAKYYIRRVRIESHNPIFHMLKEMGMSYQPEVGQFKESATTYVFEFPIKAPKKAVVKNDLTAMDQLKYWQLLKDNYTEHNPSITISVDDHEWLSVGNWIYENWDIIGGLSFLPKSDYVYKLPPYEEIKKDKYEKMCSVLPEIDFSKIVLYEYDDTTSGSKELACSAGTCEI